VRDDAVHYPLVKRIVIDLYKRGRCSKPSDPVSIDLILDYLGDLHFELKSQPGNDLDAMALLEHIGEVSISLFESEATRTAPVAPYHPRQGQGRVRQVRPRAFS
jgi:hypothetical protein